MQCCNDPLHRDSRQPCPGPTLHSPDSDDQSSRAMFPPRLSSVSTNNGNICVRPGRDQHQQQQPAPWRPSTNQEYSAPTRAAASAGPSPAGGPGISTALVLSLQFIVSPGSRSTSRIIRRLEFCRTDKNRRAHAQQRLEFNMSHPK